MKKTFKEIKDDISMRLWALRYKAEQTVRSGVKWCEENKELAIAMIPVGMFAIKSIGNSLDRQKNRPEERAESSGTLCL